MQLFALALSHVEHSKGSMSSGVLTLFWLLTVCADGVKLRTYILQMEVALLFFFPHLQHGFRDNLIFGVFLGHLALSLVSFGLSVFLEDKMCSSRRGDYVPLSSGDRFPW